MVFEHRKCFGGYRVLIGSPEGVSGTPGKRYGPYGPRGETHQSQGAGAPPIWAEPEDKERGEGRRKGGIRPPPSFPPPSSFLPPPANKAGGAGHGETPSRIRPTWAPPG